YLADLSPEDLPRPGLLALAQRLRSRGLSVSYGLKGGKFKKQMEEANETGAMRVLFYGSDRATAHSYEGKDLAMGEQNIIEEAYLWWPKTPNVRPTKAARTTSRA